MKIIPVASIPESRVLFFSDFEIQYKFHIDSPETPNHKVLFSGQNQKSLKSNAYDTLIDSFVKWREMTVLKMTSGHGDDEQHQVPFWSLFDG